MSGGPIFICGLSFTGKTPLRGALSVHPRIAMTRHTGLWIRFHGRFGDLGKPEHLQACLTALSADPLVAVLRPDPRRLAREFGDGPRTYDRLFGLLHEHHAQLLGKARWGDQLGPLDHHADRVLTAFPAARMIHTVRDLGSRLAVAVPGGRKTPGRLGRETVRWFESARRCRRNVRRYPGRYRLARYERFAADPEATVRDLCAFLGEDHYPAMSAVLERHVVERR